MSYTKTVVSNNETVTLLLVFLNAFILKIAFIQNQKWYWALMVTVPLLLVSMYDVYHKRHTRDKFPE